MHWRIGLAAYFLLALPLTAQDKKDSQNATPKLVQEPCDPPVTSVLFGHDGDAGISKRIKALFDEDQARESAARQGKDWSAIDAEDRIRQKEIMSYLEKGVVNSADDLYHAAMIFQHGNCTEHYRLANQLAEKAIANGSEPARWLYAATLDRYLMSQGKPQKFGTQFFRDGRGGKWQLYPFDPATTDDERARYNVPALAVQKQNVDKLNKATHN